MSANESLTRSRVIRRMAKLGSKRLAELDARVVRNRGLRVVSRPVRHWLNAGVLVVPSGTGHGLCFAKADLPLRHAHLPGIAFGTLEVAVQEAMRRHVAAGSVFLDVGANIGFFSVLAARMVGHRGRVYALEPVPEAAAAGRRNAGLNGFSNITVLERAAAERSGFLHLEVVGDTSWSHLAEFGRHPEAREIIEVQAVAIDDLVSPGGLPAPQVVKIDVEGAEIAVLRGMAGTVAEHRPVVICELHGTQAEFGALMDDWGYEVSNLEGTGPLAAAGPSSHWLAIPG